MSQAVSVRVRKFVRAIFLSSLVAVITPALGAGLVAGTAGALKAVADAGPIPREKDAMDERIAEPDVIPARTADAAPRKLSVLAGSDDQAWASVRTVHVRTYRTARKH